MGSMARLMERRTSVKEHELKPEPVKPKPVAKENTVQEAPFAKIASYKGISSLLGDDVGAQFEPREGSPEQRRSKAASREAILDPAGRLPAPLTEQEIQLRSGWAPVAGLSGEAYSVEPADQGKDVAPAPSAEATSAETSTVSLEMMLSQLCEQLRAERARTTAAESRVQEAEQGLMKAREEAHDLALRLARCEAKLEVLSETK